MRLTLINFIRKKPHGYAYRGKYRIVQPVTVNALYEKVLDYQREEQNMLLLRHPYLTVEQSKGHMKDLKNQKENVFMDNMNKIRNEKFSRRYTWAEQLSHLRVKDAWD